MILAEEREFRTQLMSELRRGVEAAGGVLSRAELSAFRRDNGEIQRLIDTTKGIWNPQFLKASLSILSSPDGPYEDVELEGGLYRYDYRSGSLAGDNTKLRRAFELSLPLILIRKVGRDLFVPVFPVYVSADDVDARQFLVALDETLRAIVDPFHPSELERRYAERVVRQRLHQPEFRIRVLDAYGKRCAVCRLAHTPLLDAAHITGDADEKGAAVVSNGLSLCKIHHAAYDRNYLGISTELRVRIRQDLLTEVDGPMLQHGLKDMHGATITIPVRVEHHPDRNRLEARFNEFLAAN